MSNVYASVRLPLSNCKVMARVLTKMDEDLEDAKLCSKFLKNLKGK